MTHAAPHDRPFELESIRTRDAAELLGVSVRVLEKWRREGGGPPFLRISRRCVRYRLKDIELWQEEQLA